VTFHIFLIKTEFWIVGVVGGGISPPQTSWAFLAGKKNIQFSLLLPLTKHRTR
jgi:hypothetical protein